MDKFEVKKVTPDIILKLKHRGRERIYPIQELNEGEYFIVPNKSSGNMSNVVACTRKLFPIRVFKTRTVVEGNNKYCIIMRDKDRKNAKKI